MSASEAPDPEAPETPEPADTPKNHLDGTEKKSRRRLGALPTAVVTLLCALAGTALGLLVVPRAPTADSPGETPPAVLLLGQPLPEKEGDEVAKNRLRGALGRTFSLKMPDGSVIAKSVSHWGGEVDEARLSSLLQELSDSSSPLRRHWSSLQKQDGANSTFPLPPPLHVDPSRGTTQLLTLKDKFDRAARDAKLNIATRKVIEHQLGRSLDVDATLFRIEQALSQGEFEAEAVAVTRKPRIESSALQGLKFESVLGHFETRYSRAKKAEDRTYNLRLAAKKLDGTVLLPGEEFDFNGVVGPRDEANGYKVATVIANGELVDGIGGGTCQISGTLHGAAFFAGLEIVERYPHTRPSSYIKMGMDATVVYPTINFRFRNQYGFPVALHQSVEGGVVRAEILGPSQDQVVTLIRKVDQAIPYEQIERKDSRLPKGSRILAQRGVPGFRLHRYRTIRQGSHTTREMWRDVYPSTNQVIRVGTGPANLEKKHSVGTPEYRADEVLILTQRRPKDGQPGELAENREEGRYGKRGWTKEAGMPFWMEN